MNIDDPVLLLGWRGKANFCSTFVCVYWYWRLHINPLNGRSNWMVVPSVCTLKITAVVPHGAITGYVILWEAGPSPYALKPDNFYGPVAFTFAVSLSSPRSGPPARCNHASYLHSQVTLLLWRWRQQVPSKYWQEYARLYGFTSEHWSILVIVISTVITSRITISSLWSVGQSSWLPIQRSQARFPALPESLKAVGLEQGPLNLVRIIEELLEW
jgi:hypothetical protein